MKNQKFIALFIALLTASGSIVGCAQTSTETDTTAVQPHETVLTETETQEITPNLPDSDFGGYEFRVLTRGDTNIYFISRDIYAESITGDSINDAVYNRNQAVEEKYNFTIKEIGGDTADPDKQVTKAITAGEDAYDMIMIAGTSCASLAVQKYLLELTAMPYMDLSKPWYDQSANAALSIANKLYMTSGDINIMDNDATWSILFSKKLAYDLIEEDLYSLVEEGTWTMDKMAEYCRLAYQDLNGNSKYDPDDQWALLGEPWNTMGFIGGGGSNTVEKDKNDIPYIAVDAEGFYDTFLQAMALNADESFTMISDRFASQFSDVWLECINKAFIEARALFFCTALNRVPLLRDMDTDFGILPMPKHDVAQENYNCVVSVYSANMLSVPITNADSERTGIIIEALSAASVDTLTPAYYETTLKGKSTRDEESAAMLDLIFANRAYDLGNVYAWGGMFNAIWNLTYTNDLNLASTIEKKYDAMQQAMQKTIDIFLEEDDKGQDTHADEFVEDGTHQSHLYDLRHNDPCHDKHQDAIEHVEASRCFHQLVYVIKQKRYAEYVDNIFYPEIK